MTSLYSESPFALFTFIGLFFFYRHRFFLASFAWAISGLFRSNGILYIGFFVWSWLYQIQKKTPQVDSFFILAKVEREFVDDDVLFHYSL